MVTDTLQVLPIDGWPEYIISLEAAAQFSRPGRLFLCLSMVKSYRISNPEAGTAQCQHRYQTFHSQHNTRPPFPDSLFGFLCNRRVTVPPQRANRLPSWQHPQKCYHRKRLISTIFQHICLKTRTRLYTGFFPLGIGQVLKTSIIAQAHFAKNRC